MEEKLLAPEPQPPAEIVNQRQRISEALRKLLPDPTQLTNDDRLALQRDVVRYLGPSDLSDRKPYQDALDHIQATTKDLKDLNVDLATYVKQARGAGCSWNKIGAAAGMTATQAMRKWNPETHEKQRAYTAKRWRDAKL